MINKQSLWFLTLFSLVLILGVYYITMPSSILKGNNDTEMVNKEITVNVEQSDMLASLRVERNELIASTMDELQSVLTSVSSTSDEKNNAFEELKILNLAKGKEQELEEKLFTNLKIKSYVEINNDHIKVIINSKEHDATLANKIMRNIQEEYDDKMYITVKFESV